MAPMVHTGPAAASEVDANQDADADGGVTTPVADTDAQVAPGAPDDPALADPATAGADADVEADLGGAGGSAGGGAGGASGAGGTSADAGVVASDAGRDGGADAPFVNPSPNYPDDGCSMAGSPGAGGRLGSGLAWSAWRWQRWLWSWRVGRGRRGRCVRPRPALLPAQHGCCARSS